MQPVVAFCDPIVFESRRKAAFTIDLVPGKIVRIREINCPIADNR
jgi:hypothetical protein